MALKRIKTPELGTDRVKVFYDSDLAEYQVRITGKPAATYYTSDRTDALGTAQHMRNTVAFNIEDCLPA